MQVCLINIPDSNSLDPKLDPPLGLMYLSSYLRKNGITCEILDLTFYSKRIWDSILAQHKAKIYGLTVYTTNFIDSIMVSKFIKKAHPKSKIVFGGTHPTFSPVSIIQNPEIDFIIFGEGEATLLELTQKLDEPILYSSILGLGYKTSTPYGIRAFSLNNTRETLDINKIPAPDRETIPLKNYTRKVDGELSTPFMTARGCAYNCNFCCSKMFWGKPRFLKSSLVDRELKTIYEMGFKAVHCWDDTFTLKKGKHLDNILGSLKKYDFIFRCNGNLRIDTKPVLQKLYDAGCKEYAVGIESGDQKILDIINKGTTVKRNKQVIKWCKDIGLPVKAFIMVGNPGETWDSVKKTVEFIKEVEPEYYTLSSFTPLPGSVFFHDKEKYDIKIRTTNTNEYFNVGRQNEGGMTHDVGEMTAEELKEARKYMLNNLPKQTGKLQDYYEKVK